MKPRFLFSTLLVSVPIIVGAQPLVPVTFHGSVVFDDNIWVIGGVRDGGITDAIQCSSDGIDWTDVDAGPRFGERYGHMTVVFDGKIWVLGGVTETFVDIFTPPTKTYFSDVWNSEDGVAWTQVAASSPTGGRVHAAAAVHNGKIFLFGGDDGSAFARQDVWSTTNGTSWSLVAGSTGMAERAAHALLVHDGELWSIAGFCSSQGLMNDVWQSSLGDTWTEAVPTTTIFAPRRIHSALSHNGAVWVLGGELSGWTADSGVWKSSDGEAWEEVIATTPFAGRGGHTSVVFDGKMWIIGGHTTEETKSLSMQVHGEVWSSPDGVSWTPSQLSGVEDWRLE